MKSTRKTNCKKWLSVMVCVAVLTVLGILTAFTLRPPTRTTAYAGEISPASTTRPLFTGNTGASTFTYNHNAHIRVSQRPMITVLTHGLGGSDFHWSNDGQNRFAYDADSLIENLRRNSPNGAGVYWARMDNDSILSFHLMELESGEYNYQRYIFTNMSSIGYLTMANLTRHMIIVFNSTNEVRRNTNAVKYAEFRAMLTSIIADVGYLTGGTFPKINLIGHSRGGLTNLEFAMDHPRLVCSVFSLGTPYFGSNFANINILRESVVRGGPYLTDVQSTAEQNRLMNRWNAEYNTRFRNISVHIYRGC